MILHSIHNPVVVVDDLVLLKLPVSLPGDEIGQHQEDLLLDFSILPGLVQEWFLVLIIFPDQSLQSINTTVHTSIRAPLETPKLLLNLTCLVIPGDEFYDFVDTRHRVLIKRIRKNGGVHGVVGFSDFLGLHEVNEDLAELVTGHAQLLTHLQEALEGSVQVHKSGCCISLDMLLEMLDVTFSLVLDDVGIFSRPGIQSLDGVSAVGVGGLDRGRGLVVIGREVGGGDAGPRAAHQPELHPPGFCLTLEVLLVSV